MQDRTTFKLYIANGVIGGLCALFGSVLGVFVNDKYYFLILATVVSLPIAIWLKQKRSEQ